MRCSIANCGVFVFVCLAQFPCRTLHLDLQTKLGGGKRNTPSFSSQLRLKAEIPVSQTSKVYHPHASPSLGQAPWIVSDPS